MPRISVIMPVLDEVERLDAQLDHVVSLGLHQLIVVDGGSRDGSRELLARRQDITVCHARRGRAWQLNAGAAVASGDILLFLHADVSLPHDVAAHIAEAVRVPGMVAGAFHTHTYAERPAPLAFMLPTGDLRSYIGRYPYGDQALFVRAEVFRALGGYPEIPLMEDVELSRSLYRQGKIVRVPATVRVSGRRFMAHPIYYPLLVNLIPPLYALGVPARWLTRLYGKPR